MSALLLITDILASFTETYIVIETMTKLYGSKDKSSRFYISFAVCVIIVATGSVLLTVFVPIPGIAALWGYIVFLFFALLKLNGVPFYKLATLLILFLLIFAIDIALMQAICFVFKVDAPTVLQGNGLKIILTISAKITLFTITRIILFSRHKELNNYNRGYWWISGVISAISIFIMVTAIYVQMTSPYKDFDLFMMSSLLALPIVNIVVYYLILRISGDNLLINKNNLINQHNEMLIHHYKEVDKAKSQLKHVYHDFQNHIAYMDNYIQNNEIDKLQKYFGKLKEGSPDILKFPPTNNKSIDAVLEFKLSKAVQKGIKVIIVGIVPGEINVEDFDICCILSNILDNAIEACDMIDENKNKFIKCNFSVNKNRLKIEITNPVIKYEKDLSTLKQDKELHGIGLESVKLTVEKIGGMAHFGIENGLFYSKIILNI